MSYFRDEGFRIFATGEFDDEEKDFKRLYGIEFKNMARKVTGRKVDGEVKRFETREDAEDAAQEMIEQRPDLVGTITESDKDE
jgi:hypothetical protein